ncbi:hypothetical protein PDJAM_G00222710 [Pangasius djambal]|uniref:Uncharacterized protein n=1 Tax=Pangasius djambal TaxID=1691987 RepID=A0ACC5YE87_9TELE|nr:hypothetical protein [Pangasius djambal]
MVEKKKKKLKVQETRLKYWADTKQTQKSAQKSPTEAVAAYKRNAMKGWAHIHHTCWHQRLRRLH